MKLGRSKTIYLKDRRKFGRRGKGPKQIWASVIAVAVIAGLIWAYWPNAYEVSIAGTPVGILEEAEYIENAKETVIAQLESTYATGVKLEGEENIVVKKARAKKKQMITPNYLVTYMRENMDFLLEFRELSVDGNKIGIIESEEVMDELLERLTKTYIGETTGEVTFKNKMELKPVFAKEKDLMDIEILVEKATKTTPKLVEYEVVAGDTLWGIANKLGITIAKLIGSNEGMTEKTVLNIGNKVKAQVDVPLIDIEVKELPKVEETPAPVAP